MHLAGMLEKLYARRRFGIRPGVERVRTLLDRLGNPERCFRAIHVVGTNGKGSTAAFLSTVLSAAGHCTALFTSPHLVNFSERFRINGQEPGVEQLSLRLESVLSLASDDTTFFEIVTALAALTFAEERATFAVLEAGMGGRSDATAALPGMMTVITPISLDHRDYLGTTLEEIATEKAGIIEPGTVVITARQSASVSVIIKALCTERNIRLLRADEDFSAVRNSSGRLDYRGIHATLKDLTPGVPGNYQTENASLALAAAETLADLGVSLTPAAMESGLSATRWPGRMELIPGHPPLLLDGAHNPAGATALAGALSDYRYRRLLMVVGIMADKDARKIIAPLSPFVTKCYCVTPDLERALPDSELAAILTGFGLEARACGSVGNGISAARAEAGEDDLILVCGSLFTVGEAKAWLTGSRFTGIRG